MNELKFIGEILIESYRAEPDKTVTLLLENYFQERDRLLSLKTPDEFFEMEEVIAKTVPEEEPFKSIARGTLNGEVEQTVQLVELALSNRVQPQDIVMKGLLPGVQAAADLYDARIFFAPELLMAGETIKEATDVATKDMKGVQKRGTILMHAPVNDIHDIGKNIVKIVLEANMFDVIDVGVDVTSEKMVEAIKQHNPIMITGSALMTTTMPAFIETSKLLKESSVNIPFAMGGAPVTKKWVEGIEFGVYGRSPKQAIEIAELAEQGLAWQDIRAKLHG